MCWVHTLGHCVFDFFSSLPSEDTQRYKDIMKIFDKTFQRRIIFELIYSPYSSFCQCSAKHRVDQSVHNDDTQKDIYFENGSFGF